jgi:DNA helicase TIP49 (TBP-interacting protein)
VAVGDSIVFDKPANKIIKTKENTVLQGKIDRIELDPKDTYKGKIILVTPYDEKELILTPEMIAEMEIEKIKPGDTVQIDKKTQAVKKIKPDEDPLIEHPFGKQ